MDGTRAMGADGEAEKVLWMAESNVSLALLCNHCHGSNRTRLHRNCDHLHQSNQSSLQGIIGPNFRMMATFGGTMKGRWVCGLRLRDPRRSSHTKLMRSRGEALRNHETSKRHVGCVAGGGRGHHL